MAFHHRLPALFTALFSSAAVLTAAFAGASCSFLVLNGTSNDGMDGFTDSTGNSNSNSSSDTFGILCEHDFYPREGDKMWELSRIFLIVGLTLGSVTAALSWAVASFLTPTGFNWNVISVLAAITAVVQVPIFVLFEAEPCLGFSDGAIDIDIDIDGNGSSGSGIDASSSSFFYKTSTSDVSCRLGPGSYALMASDLLFVVVTLITQCLDRPRWGLELDLWKVHRRGASNSRSKSSMQLRNDEYYYDDEENYDDSVRLTGRQHKRRGRNRASDDDDYDNDDDYPHQLSSTILPAGNNNNDNDIAKHSDHNPEATTATATTTTKTKTKNGFFSRLFRPPSPDLPAVETRSMSSSADEEGEREHEHPYEHDSEHEYDYETQMPENSNLLLRIVVPPTAGGTTTPSPSSSFLPPQLQPPSLSSSASASSSNMDGHEVSIRSYEKIRAREELRGHTVANEPVRSVRSPDATGTYHPNSYAPSAHDAHADVNVNVNVNVERHHYIDSPSTSFSIVSKESGVVARPAATATATRSSGVDVNDILEDLHIEEQIVAQSKIASSSGEYDAPGTKPSALTTSVVAGGVRKLSKKLKLVDSSKRRSSNKNSVGKKISLLKKTNIFHNRKAHYALIDDNYESDDNDNAYNHEQYSPYNDGDNNATGANTPQQLRLVSSSTSHSTVEDIHIQTTVTSNTFAGASNQMVDEASEGDNLYEEDGISFLDSSNWNLDFPGGKISSDTANTTNENTNNDPFDCISIGSTYSDPGPIIRTNSNESHDEIFDFSIDRGCDDDDEHEQEQRSSSFGEIFKFSTEDEIQWEPEFGNESLIATVDYDDDDVDDDDYYDSQLDPGSQEQRGRSVGRNDRRRRRPISPVGSIRSNASLLHTTIDEETEEDLENERCLDSPYSIKRTLSCPEQRSFTSPITIRKNKSTKELLKKLEKLKRTIDTDDEIDPNISAGKNSDELKHNVSDVSKNHNLPPLSPRESTKNVNYLKRSGNNASSETLPAPVDEPFREESNAIEEHLIYDSDNEEDTLVNPIDETAETLKPVRDDSQKDISAGNSIEEPELPSSKNQYDVQDPPAIQNPTRKKPEPPTKEPEPDQKPTKPPTNTVLRKETISPNKNNASVVDSMMSRMLDLSDETSDTGCTRSTMSDSDGSSASGSETGTRHMRSKSTGRGGRSKKIRHFRASSSLSPTRSNTTLLGDGANTMRTKNISSLARESRIRRLQRRKGYMPLDNENNLRAQSPTPRDPYSSDRSKNPDDLELTPKRKTVGLTRSQQENDGTCENSIDNDSEISNDLFRTSLKDPNQTCPEFDNILDQLDLQLIDLRRPVGAEYGDDEQSM
eukprot:CAMPEP_0168312778 /NCGR_PEP_ID=MMETSP0142_2-20121227/68072_1 /TAXON_ID=44445 /ORGANISM="Pseudo-nitzschia australis, Strain 10249 10 AB" /LENGTH=1335 /DNA_ID=CAMNT_0008265757 /DNA_START=48 /DNA_END=4055 /DNA_ORIENTATION=-